MPPNIVLVICDDLAYGDLAVHGNPWRRPGRLDQLHAESARLTRYCSGPMCAPARASLMTGRHYYRTGVVDTSAGRAMMHPDEITLAELAKAAGYRTGLFGKWHLGDAYPLRAIDQGFDEAVTFNAGYIGQLAYPQPTGYDDPVLEHNGEWRRNKGYCTDIFTAEAIRFIKSAAGQNRQSQNENDAGAQNLAPAARPFFAYIAYNAPHTPLEVAESWVAPYRNTELPEKFAKVYGMVDNLDANMARLLAALDEAGVAEHTIVIFTSDHGPCGSAAHEGRDRFNAGLRGRKGTVYEGGLRVPCFIRWPERIPGGRDIEAVANPIDLLPTLAAACGFSAPDDRAIDGVDLTPLLYGELEAAQWPERAIFIQQDRMQDRPRRYQNYTAITQRYKLCRSRLEAADELYDLQADPYEQHDLAAVMPAQVERLRAVYDAWFAAVEAERNFAPPRIGLGSPAAPVVRLTRQDWLGPGRVHMTDVEIGYWDVDVVAAGRLDVRVHLPPLAHAGTLRFALGEQAFAAHVAAGQDVQVFAVEAAAGESRVEAWVEEAGGARKGAAYVEVARARRPESEVTWVHAVHDNKPRVLILTDISSLTAKVAEPDDGQSLLRLLLYACDLEIEGLIATASTHGNTVRPHLIDEAIDAYAQVHSNLLLHHPEYPHPDRLRRLVRTGQPCAGPQVPVFECIGEGKDTAGSDHISAAVDRPDPRPLWVCIWGGSADLAQALWKVAQTRTPSELAAFVAKLRVYAIYDQDSTGAWLKATFPDLFTITTNHGVRGMYRGGDTALVSPEWVERHIRQGHGPLGALYPNYDGGDVWSGRLGRVRGIKEGDTPSFLALLPVGLGDVSSPDWRPEWGGWGGRFERCGGKASQFANAVDLLPGYEADTHPAMAAVYRWRPAYQADFQARLDWCAAPYAEANHPPVVVCAGRSGTDVVRFDARPGERIVLSAAGSADPDGNALAYAWWIYREASTGEQGASLAADSGLETALRIDPSARPGDEIHVILAVTDDGEPPLTRYRRVIVRVD